MWIKSSKVDKPNRVVSTTKKEIDINESSLRPQKLSEYVWQELIKKHLEVSIKSAQTRKVPLEHILFYGPPGLWKTTLSNIIATEMWWYLKITSGPAIEKQADLVSILSNLEEGDILFIDEIHRLRAPIEEILYTAMEDFVIDIVVGKWTWAQSVRMPVNNFTLVWATTKLSSLSSPLRDRFWNIMKLDFYSSDDLWLIIQNNAIKIDLELDKNVIEKISKRSRWTPRIANRLLKIIRDYSVIGKNINDENIFNEIFDWIWVDENGLDYLDKKYIEALYQKFMWWPVWLSTIASSLWEEEWTIEDVVEPFLLQIWFLEKTSRWRKLTNNAIKSIGWIV